jgi:hypothetical protein
MKMCKRSVFLFDTLKSSYNLISERIFIKDQKVFGYGEETGDMRELNSGGK